MNSEFTNKLIRQVKQALSEDIAHEDVTANLIPEKKQLKFQLLSREPCILCGTHWFNESFLQLDKNCKIEWQVSDKENILPDKNICSIEGNARSLLSAERTALNFLQTLSATATVTSKYVERIKHTPCQLLDTRKTIPLLRDAQKYAVICGGGANHRFGLYDAFLIKENHIAASNSIKDAVQRARALHPHLFLEVEVENLEQLEEVIFAGADRALLDNFTINTLKEAVTLNKQRIQLEASGNITQDSIALVAETGVDFISTGAITKHIKAIDFSLRFA